MGVNLCGKRRYKRVIDIKVLSQKIEVMVKRIEELRTSISEIVKELEDEE